jgi:hypothetical protein
MAEDRDMIPDANGEPPQSLPLEPTIPEDEDYALLSTQEFVVELRALEDTAAPALPDDIEQVEEAEPGDTAQAVETVESSAAALAAVTEEDRLRQPRAGQFRRRLRNQLGLLPLALLLLGVGAFLLARQQDVEGLPDLSNRVLIEISLLAVGFTTFFYALVYGRREHGLLFIGLWIGSTAGMLGILVYGIDPTPDAAEWWPLLVWALSLAILLTYLFEHTHDARLVLLSVLLFVAGGVAFWVNSDRVDQQVLDQVADYWPLLLSVIGIGLLPLAFRRRTG